jgi:tetratricopeptide (TPR) repeat protein
MELPDHERLRRVLPWLILALAVAVRVAFLAEWRSNPFLESPVLDARGYVEWAAEIDAGNLVWDELRIHGPGYPYFLAIVLRLTGHDLALATYVNALLGCAWILLLLATVRRLLPFPTAEITAALAAVYWPFLHFEGHLLATTWFTFLVVAAAWLVTRAVTGAARPGLTLLAGGVVLGLATVTRPNPVVVLPVVAAILMRGRAAGTAAPAPARAARVALLVAGFALPVTPVLVQNHRLSGTIALQDHTGFNLYLGNGPGSPGYVSVRLGSEWDALSDAPRREAGAVTAAERNAWFLHRVVEHARAHPLRFLRLQARKVLLFLNRHEIRTTLSPYFFERFAPLQGVLPGFGLVGPLALVGLVLAWRAPRRPWVLVAFALPSAALVIATVVGSRYRAPVVPFLLPFAAWTLVRSGAWIRERRAARVGLTGAGVAAAAAVVFLPFPELTRDFGAEAAQVASVLESRGDFDEAESWWDRARREDPDRLEVYVGHAELALALEEWGRVEELTRGGLARYPGHPLLLLMRGRALLLLHRPQESIDALRRVLPARPGDPDLLAGLARAFADAGRADSSLYYFGRAIDADPDRPEVLDDAATLLEGLAGVDALPPAQRDDFRARARAFRERARRLTAGPR